jgi:hypothetical protein
MPRRVPRSAIAAAAVAVLSLAIAGPASARPDSRALTCEQASALVNKSGKIVMSTGAYTFDQIFSSSANCRATIAQKKFAPTRDNANCQIGYICLPYTGGNH